MLLKLALFFKRSLQKYSFLQHFCLLFGCFVQSALKIKANPFGQEIKKIDFFSFYSTKERMGAHSSVNTSSVNGIYKVVSTIFQLKSVVSTLNLGCKVRSTLVPSNINTILKSQVIRTAEIIEIRLG